MFGYLILGCVGGNGARAACGEVYVVGDAVQTGSANNATESALAAVLSL